MEPGAQVRPKRADLFRNWISLSGAVIAGGSFFAFLLLFAIDLMSSGGSPYMGILAYVVAPGFTLLGLTLIIGGYVRHRRRLTRRGPDTPLQDLRINLSLPRDQKRFALFLLGTLVFLLATAIGSQRTYHYTESVQFCGQACHEPMKPEFTTYQHSPHARVACVDCHVGPGTTFYLKAKINGVKQLYSTLTDQFQRPIPTPVPNLRPAQDTCEQCHWPQRYVGNLDRLYEHFLADETNTPFTVRLSLKVGGGDPEVGPADGIHWHMNLDNKVEYIAIDPQRQVIPWVRLTDAQGVVTEFRAPDFKDDPVQHVIRTMDCMDCHNRPAHQFQTPNDAVDLAITNGRIDRGLPWVKSNVVALLTGSYTTELEALDTIASALRSRYPAHSELDELVGTVQGLFRQNIFPEMKANWQAYPDHNGHKNWAGCFRCHDGQHKTADGTRSIKASDCNSCHTILAQGSGGQLDQLSAAGHDFLHIDAPYSDFACAECHTGAFPK